MKKLYLIITAASLGLSINYELQTKDKTSNTPKGEALGANPYTFAPRLFTSETDATGKFWAGNGTKKYPGKAFLGEIEYINVITLEKSIVDTKEGKKQRKNKQYLGSYIDEQSGKVFYLYGIKKVQDKIDTSPDADVLTEIAIKEDFGPGE